MAGFSDLLRELRPTLALAFPIIIGQVSQMLMGVTDSVMIEQVGKVPLAAAAFAHSLWVIVFILGIGLLTSVSVLAARLLVVAAVFQLFDGGQVIGAGALRGLADVKLPTLITFIAYWVIALPGGCWLAFKTPLGPIGVWTGLAGGLACAALLLCWRFHRLTTPVRV